MWIEEEICSIKGADETKTNPIQFEVAQIITLLKVDLLYLAWYIQLTSPK